MRSVKENYQQCMRMFHVISFYVLVDKEVHDKYILDKFTGFMVFSGPENTRFVSTLIMNTNSLFNFKILDLHRKGKENF